MILPVGETAITLLIVAGFAALGETILWRRSEDVFSWNESFLIGAGTSGALLFPFSLALGGNALRGTLGLLGIAIVLAIVRRLRARTKPLLPEGRRPRTGRDPVALALLAGIAIIALVFAALNFRYSYLWDGFQIWASKAQILYQQGRLGSEWYPGFTGPSRVLNYPALVPLYQALLCVVRGGFDFDVLKPVFLVFYLSMLSSTFAAARSVLSTRSAMAATLLLALLPAVSTGLSAGGYADMPQATFVAGVMAAGLRAREEESGWRHPLPWLIGSLTTVKAEGVLLALIACAGIALLWWFEKPRLFLGRCRKEAGGIVVILAFLALRWGYLRWLNIPDLDTGPLDSPHLARAWTLLRLDATLCLRALLDLRDWALLWPAFIVAAVVSTARGASRERCLALATASALAMYSGIFLFSNWPLEVHVPNAYPRLLVHLAAPAVVTILIGYARMRESLELATSASSNGPRLRRGARHVEPLIRLSPRS